MPAGPARRAALPAAATVLVLVGGLASAEAAKTCKDWGFVGQVVGTNAGQTQALARADWKAKVATYWGPQWSHWSMAKLRWQSCEPWRRQFRCIANAVPCSPSLGLSR